MINSSETPKEDEKVKVSCKLTLFPVTVLALMIAVSVMLAHADQVLVQSVSYGPAATNFSGKDMGSIAQFNTSLGTLDSITVDFTGSISGNVTLTNNGVSTSNVNGSELAYFALGSTNSRLNTYLSGYQLNDVSTNVVTQDLAAGATGEKTAVSGQGTKTFQIDAADLAFFEGTGSIDPFDLTAMASVNTSADDGDGNANYNASAGGVAEISYDYTPAPPPPPGVTPEPGTLGLLGSGLLGLAGLLRSRFARSR